MTKTDKLIFWGTLLIAVLLLLFSNVILVQNGEKTAVIEVGGKPYARYGLNAIDTPQILEIETEFGYNKIEIFSGGVRIFDSDCKDKQCIGEIRRAGEMLVCLPHRLVLKIEGNKEVDGVAY